MGEILFLSLYLDHFQEFYKDSDNKSSESIRINGYYLSTTLINLSKTLIELNTAERSLLLFMRLLDLSINPEDFHRAINDHQ